MNLWLKGYYIIEIFTFITGFIHKCTLKFVHQRASRNPAKSHGIAQFTKSRACRAVAKKWDGFQ